jgi:cell pole-organizing protein PopZ
MSSPQHEPTMEEILASIRKIISEDAPEAVPAAEAPVATAEAAAKQELLATPEEDAPEIEVLELTQEVYEAPSEVVAAVEPPKPIIDDVVFEAAQSAPDPSQAPATDDGIFSDQTRRAMDDTFASIADQHAEPAQAPRPAPAPLTSIGGSTVENVFERAVRESFEPVMAKYLADNSSAVIDRMKPLIREWMDEHFPALLEGAVRTEIERVVKARGKR